MNSYARMTEGSIFNALQKLLILTLVFVMGFSMLFPTVAQAHETYYLQTTLNDDGQGYSFTVQHDAPWSEGGHLSNKHKTRMDNENVWGKGSDKIEDNIISKGWSDDEYFPFNFNPIKVKGNLFFSENHSTTYDSERATLVGQVLVSNLNAAIDFMFEGAFSEIDSTSENGEGFEDSIQSGRKLAQAISQFHQSDGKGTVTYSNKGRTFTFSAPNKVEFDASLGVHKNDFVEITRADGEKGIFQYRMLKGYNMDGVENKYPAFKKRHQALTRGFKMEPDVVYLNWNMLISQANRLAVMKKGFTTGGFTKEDDVGIVTRHVGKLGEDILRQVTSFLSLYGMHEIVFSTGVRDLEYYYGVFPRQWKGIIDMFYVITTSLATLLLVFALLKLLYDRSVSLLNPRKRASLMEGIMNFLIAVAIMLFFPIIIDFILQLNITIVRIFSGLGVNLNEVTQLGSNHWLAYIIFQFFVLFILFRLNLMYFMRSAIVVLLIIASPLFIAALAFSGQKEKFDLFLKELLGNIFVQSFQAFVITFLMLVIPSERPVGSIAILLLFFEGTKLFRSMVFGTGGDLADRLGGKSAASSIAMGAALGGSVGKAGRSAVGGLFGRGGGGRGRNTSSQSSQQSTSNSPSNQQELSRYGRNKNTEEKRTGEGQPTMSHSSHDKNNPLNKRQQEEVPKEGQGEGTSEGKPDGKTDGKDTVDPNEKTPSSEEKTINHKEDGKTTGKEVDYEAPDNNNIPEESEERFGRTGEKIKDGLNRVKDAGYTVGTAFDNAKNSKTGVITAGIIGAGAAVGSGIGKSSAAMGYSMAVGDAVSTPELQNLARKEMSDAARPNKTSREVSPVLGGGEKPNFGSGGGGSKGLPPVPKNSIMNKSFGGGGSGGSGGKGKAPYTINRQQARQQGFQSAKMMRDGKTIAMKYDTSKMSASERTHFKSMAQAYSNPKATPQQRQQVRQAFRKQGIRHVDMNSKGQATVYYDKKKLNIDSVKNTKENIQFNPINSAQQSKVYQGVDYNQLQNDIVESGGEVPEVVSNINEGQGYAYEEGHHNDFSTPEFEQPDYTGHDQDVDFNNYDDGYNHDGYNHNDNNEV